MSVRVNLLPEATRARSRAARQRVYAGLVALTLLAVLAGVYAWSGMQLADAEDELAAEQAVSAGLRSREAALVAYRELQQRLAVADDTLMQVLGDEVSLAAVLQDVAVALPDDTQLESISITLSGGGETNSVGSFNASAITLNSHAPGVERTLLSFEQLVTFRELYLNSSSVSGGEAGAGVEGEDGGEEVANFTFDGAITPHVLTNRYRDGLPEGAS